MESTISDIEFLQRRYSVARNKYRPKNIKILIVAEAPPCTLDRFFYFEDVKRQDSLFLEVMGVLYPEKKAAYLESARNTLLKKDLLENFQSDGFWLLDLSDIPISINTNTLTSCIPSLISKLEKYKVQITPIVLIKSNVYDCCYGPLVFKGYHVINERIPFPGSGQQKVFREKFKKALGII